MVGLSRVFEEKEVRVATENGGTELTGEKRFFVFCFFPTEVAPPTYVGQVHTARRHTAVD